MDLTQTKFSRREWTDIEVPVADDEKVILELICAGFNNPELHTNVHKSLFTFTKIERTLATEQFLFETYFQQKVTAISTRLFGSYTPPIGKDNKLKKIDKMRIDNLNANIERNKTKIIEFMFIDLAEKLSRPQSPAKDEVAFSLYTLIHLLSCSFTGINCYVKQFIETVINYGRTIVPPRIIIQNAYNIIEKNPYLLKYEDRVLYQHQKDLFGLFTSEEPRLVLYIAPTGSGKTLSPLGLSERYRVIFVCCARHIGLSLAKNAVSMGKKIAIALGCDTASDIRLHNSAASTYIRNEKTGGIGKIDNSDGRLVEIMICDVKSYLIAMLYMLAFNAESRIITYWDEPTITLDYETHQLHETIHQNWIQNRISKLVLSCATLPKEDEITATIVDFQERFAGAKVDTIQSFDCKKSITMIGRDGKYVLPHLLFSRYNDAYKCAQYCLQNKTILRYLNLEGIIRFIDYWLDQMPSMTTELIDRSFPTIESVTMTSLKIWYLNLITNIDPDRWTACNAYLTSTLTPVYPTRVNPATKLRKVHSYDPTIGNTAAKPLTKQHSVDSLVTEKPAFEGVLLTTKDSHTLTDGPTIYITEDVLKMEQFYIQQSGIPSAVFADIMQKVGQNNSLQRRITVLEKNIEDALGKECEKVQKMQKKTEIEDFNGEIRRLKTELSQLQQQVESVQLHEIYVPNSRLHQEKWMFGETMANAFKPSVEEEHIRQIMMLEVTNNMKILLLLGIGVFMNDPNPAYMEIMKALAYDQKLYLIIASSDYIYGTNYQFCHGFIGKDLEHMTQQKAIQALGRIGRGNIQQEYTVRFRNDEVLMKLFKPMDTNLEAVNMSTLFCS
jgi:hypothetical protein